MDHLYICETGCPAAIPSIVDVLSTQTLFCCLPLAVQIAQTQQY
jgi:hypothetical protein